MKRAVKLPQYSDAKNFPAPSGVVQVTLDKVTNRLATPSCPQDYTVAFIAGTEPTETCDAGLRRPSRNLHQDSWTGLASGRSAAAHNQWCGSGCGLQRTAGPGRDHRRLPSRPSRLQPRRRRDSSAGSSARGDSSNDQPQNSDAGSADNGNNPRTQIGLLWCGTGRSRSGHGSSPIVADIAVAILRSALASRFAMCLQAAPEQEVAPPPAPVPNLNDFGTATGGARRSVARSRSDTSTPSTSTARPSPNNQPHCSGTRRAWLICSCSALRTLPSLSIMLSSSTSTAPEGYNNLGYMQYRNEKYGQSDHVLPESSVVASR